MHHYWSYYWTKQVQILAWWYYIIHREMVNLNLKSRISVLINLMCLCQKSISIWCGYCLTLLSGLIVCLWTIRHILSIDLTLTLYPVWFLIVLLNVVPWWSELRFCHHFYSFLLYAFIIVEILQGLHIVKLSILPIQEIIIW